MTALALYRPPQLERTPVDFVTLRSFGAGGSSANERFPLDAFPEGGFLIQTCVVTIAAAFGAGGARVEMVGIGPEATVAGVNWWDLPLYCARGFDAAPPAALIPDNGNASMGATTTTNSRGAFNFPELAGFVLPNLPPRLWLYTNYDGAGSFTWNVTISGWSFPPGNML